MLKWLKENEAIIIKTLSAVDAPRIKTEAYIAFFITQVLKKTIDYVNIECGTWRDLNNRQTQYDK